MDKARGVFRVNREDVFFRFEISIHVPNKAALAQCRNRRRTKPERISIGQIILKATRSVIRLLIPSPSGLNIKIVDYLSIRKVLPQFYLPHNQMYLPKTFIRDIQ